jgi:hypothetical protein
MPASPRRTVDDYITGIPAPLDSVASELRRAILEAAPEARELIKWGQPVYESGGPFAALKAFPRWVTLTFWRGAAMAQRAGILAGDGDRMRHARFATAEEVRAAPVRDLVREAVRLNHELGDPTKRG